MKFTQDRRQEIEISKAYLEKNDKEVKIVNEMINFFEMYDVIEKSMHSKIIHKLYCERNDSIRIIYKNFFIDEKTLYKFRKKYLQIYNYIKYSVKKII